MQNRVARAIVSILLTGVFLFLSPLKTLADDQARKERHRLLHYQYSLRNGASHSTASRAGALLRTDRRRLRTEQRLQSEQTCRLAQAADDSETLSARRLASACTEQGGIKKKQRHGSRTRSFFVAENRREICPSVVVTLIEQTPTEECAPKPTVESVPAPRFGSGPLRSIPRPRENTPPPTAPDATVAA